MSNLFELS